MEIKDLENIFSYHAPPNEEIRQAHEAIRNQCLRHSIDLNNQLPECDEKKYAIKALETVMFWANAAVARNAPKVE
jgi:hypothetical protein